MKAPNRGSREAVPAQIFTFLAAVAVLCLSGPVRYDIKFPLIPKYDILSATSTPKLTFTIHFNYHYI